MMNIINHEHGFEKMFLLHGVSSVIAFMFMLHCVPTDQSSTKEVHTTQLSKRKVGWKEGVRVILSDAGLFGIFGLVTVAGFSMAILENFCYINIRKQYAESDMMDVAGREISFYRICFSLGGTLTWWFAGSWSRRFGSDVVMFAAVCCLPICFFSYAGLGSGSGVDQLTKVGFLIAEAIRSGVFAALWSNATVQMNKRSPSHVKSVMQTMMEATYRGVGHTSGSYFGGMLCKDLGIQSAYTVVGKGLVSFLCMVGALGFGFSTPKTKIGV